MSLDKCHFKSLRIFFLICLPFILRESIHFLNMNWKYPSLLYSRQNFRLVSAQGSGSAHLLSCLAKPACSEFYFLICFHRLLSFCSTHFLLILQISTLSPSPKKPNRQKKGLWIPSVCSRSILFRTCQCIYDYVEVVNSPVLFFFKHYIVEE